jgi:non-heme chloroperoxidase
MSKRFLVSFLLLLAGASPGHAFFNEQREIPLTTGVTIEYEQQGLESGQPVIFLHGYLDSWYSFARVKPLLPKEIRAYFLSLRGHGDSSKNAGSYTPADFAADVLAFMDAKGIEKATIVGHNLGSFLAQKMAIENKERVAAIVLIGSAPVAGNETMVGIEELVRSLDELDPFAIAFLQAAAFCELPPDEVYEAMVAEYLKTPLPVWQATLAGLVAEDNSARLGELEAPALVVTGMEDPLYGKDEQLQLARAIPKADLVLYRNQCHAPHWEGAKRFTEDLLQFLKKRVGQSEGWP